MTSDTIGLYQYAVHHGHLATTPLFRPLQKMPAVKRMRREIIYESGPSAKKPYRLQIVCPWELDADDESVLMALLAVMATADRRKIVSAGSGFRGILGESGNGATEQTIAAVATRLEILNLVGWGTNGRSYDRLEESLKRLENTNLNYFSSDQQSQHSRLIGIHRPLSTGCERDGGKLTILLNRLSASVILGEANAGMAIHWLAERRMLDTQISKILYSRLVFLISEGNKRSIRVMTLANSIFSLNDEQRPTPKQWRNLVVALQTFNLPGWTIKIEGRGDSTKVEVHRPKPS